MENQSRAGFSLIELLIVLAILGILLAIVSPLLRADRTSVDQTARLVAAQVNLARLEAIRRNTLVGIRITPATSATPVYDICYDLDNDALNGLTCNSSTVVRTFTFGDGDYRRVQIDTSASSLGQFPLIFDPRGIPSGPVNSTVVIRNRSGTYYGRAVCISSQGRSRVSQTNTCS